MIVHLCEETDLQDVHARQFLDRVQAADAAFRNARARGVPMYAAARARDRALREACIERDRHGIAPPVAKSTLPNRDIFGADAVVSRTATSRKA